MQFYLRLPALLGIKSMCGGEIAVNTGFISNRN